MRARRAFEWFLGRNHLQRPLYDFATGGCSDGLGSEALNANEGAESTLAFHRAALLLDATGVRASISRAGRRVSERELFTRHPGNPILTAEDWPYPVNAVFNPAAARLDGETVLLARVEDLTGISHLSVARSANGVDGWVGRRGAAARARGRRRERAVGIRGPARRLDRRARALGDHLHRVRPGRARRSTSRRPWTSGPSSATGSSGSPRTRTRRLLPYRIDGRWVLLHRPKTEFGGARRRDPPLPLRRIS